MESPVNSSNQNRSRDFLQRAGRVRWLILALSCFIMFGNYYAFDNPSALNRQLRRWMPKQSHAEYEYRLNLIYTIYSAPNVILPFFVGRALDRVGSRSFLIGLSVLVCAGQLIFAVGVTVQSWTWMLIGRLIFGFGGESLAVAQSRLVTEWFLGRELGLAIGLTLSIARIGTVFNNNISPRIASTSPASGGGVPGACWAGLVTCLFSFACTMACVFIDSIYRPIESIEEEPSVSEKKSLLKSLVFSSNSRAKLLPTLKDSLSTNSFYIHPAFYLVLLVNFTSFGAVLCFNNIASAYLQERYFAGRILKANLAMSIPDSTAIFLVPLIGLLVDWSGWKLGTISLGQLTLCLGHALLARGMRPQRPYAALMCLGAGYSTLLAMWSCVPYLVGSRRQATAYGFLTASSNLSVTLLPMAVAAFINADSSFHAVGLFFAALGMIGCLICGGLFVLNRRWGLGLNSPKFPSHMVGFYQVGSGDKNTQSLETVDAVDVAVYEEEEIDVENRPAYGNHPGNSGKNFVKAFPRRPNQILDSTV